jgi:phosphoribosylformylglycinamidine synthase
MVEGLSGGEVPKVDPQLAKRTFAALHHAIHSGLVRACHDLSEGGLAVALAEMAFAGGLGAKIDLAAVPRGLSQFSSDENGTVPFTPAVLLFSESNTRFLCEVPPAHAAAFEAALSGVPQARIGEVTAAAKLEILADADTVLSAGLSTLKEAWQKPLRW